MGEDKAFLKIGEKTFLENAVEILNPVCAQTKIVLNKSQNHFIEKIPGGVSYVFDVYENRGALGGIHAAMKDCQTEFAAVLAIDLPFATSEAVEKLCEIILAEKDISAVVPRQPDGKLQPLCAVYRTKNCLQKAEEILSKTDSASVRFFLEKLNTEIIDALILDENKDLFLNVNNPHEYQNLLY